MRGGGLSTEPPHPPGHPGRGQPGSECRHLRKGHLGLGLCAGEGPRCTTHGGAALSRSCPGPTRTNLGAVVGTGTGTGRQPWEPMAGRANLVWPLVRTATEKVLLIAVRPEGQSGTVSQEREQQGQRSGGRGRGGGGGMAYRQSWNWRGCEWRGQRVGSLKLRLGTGPSSIWIWGDPSGSLLLWKQVAGSCASLAVT